MKRSLSIILTLSISFICTQSFAQTEEKLKVTHGAELQIPEEDPTYAIVEEMPEFPEGNKAMYKFIQKEVQYPQIAVEQGIQGTVYVNFVIDKTGTISKVRVLRGVHESLDNEAMRVVKAMPKWTPGTQRGKPVNVYYNLPIRFIL